MFKIVKLESGDQIEASVRMQYVTIEFAMDSNAPQDETEKKRYDEFISVIANKDDYKYEANFWKWRRVASRRK